MKKLILLLMIIPSLAWAGMNPYIAGIVRSSGGDSDYTTTIFSYNFNVTDGSDPTSVGAPTDTWGTETDADNDGNISSNAYVMTVDDNNNINLKTSLFSAATDIQLEYDIKLSTLELGSYGASFELRNNNYSYMSVAKYKSGSEVDTLRIIYRDDSGGHVAYSAVPWVAGTWHTIKLQYKKSSGTDTNDGYAKVFFDGIAVLNVVDLDNDTYTGATWCDGGNGSYTADGTISFDNVTVKSP